MDRNITQPWLFEPQAWEHHKTRLFSGRFFYFLGFWSPIILPLSPKSILLFPQGLLNSVEDIGLKNYNHPKIEYGEYGLCRECVMIRSKIIFYVLQDGCIPK